MWMILKLYQEKFYLAAKLHSLCLPLWRNLIIYHKQQEVAVLFYYISDYSTEGIFVIGQKWSEEYKHPINEQLLQNFK